MPRRLKDYLIILRIGVCLSTSVPAERTAPEQEALLGRAGAVKLDTPLNKRQRQWVQNKRELILGTSAPD